MQLRFSAQYCKSFHDRSGLEMAIRLERLHDLQGGIGVVGGIAQLRGAELGERPVTGGDGFGFLEALLEQNTHSSTNTDLPAVAQGAEGLVQIENMVQGDSQSIPNLPAIVLQAEAHLEHTLGGDQLSSGLLALTAMKLKDEGLVSKGKLHDMRAIALLSFPKGRLGFGVKSANPGSNYFGDRFLALGLGSGNVDLIRTKSLEGRQACGLRFSRGHQSDLRNLSFTPLLLDWIGDIGTGVRGR